MFREVVDGRGNASKGKLIRGEAYLEERRNVVVKVGDDRSNNFGWSVEIDVIEQRIGTIRGKIVREGKDNGTMGVTFASSDDSRGDRR